MERYYKFMIGKNRQGKMTYGTDTDFIKSLKEFYKFIHDTI